MMRYLIFILFLFGIFINVNAQTIKVQPYPQDVTTNSTYILWETSSGTESIVEWGLSNSLGNSTSGTSFSATDNISKMHEVQLIGLSADTKYYYRVKTGSTVSAIYRFNTNPLPESEKSFNFVAVSDMQNDSSNPNVFYQINHDGILDYFNDMNGGNIEDNLGLILSTGDLVMSGSTYNQWQQTYFSQAEGLLQFVGNYPVLGNHEVNSLNYFNYFHLPTNGPSGYTEHTWYKDYSNVRFIGLDSNYEVVNYQTQAQLDWLTATLNDAASNQNIDFVILQLHHPYKSEMWTPGEVAYTGQVINRLEQFSNSTGKPSMHLFGHTHGYSRGQSKDAKHFWIDVATAGGYIDYWGVYPNEDYPTFSVSHDEYGFVVFEVTAGDNPKIVVKRLSRGDAFTPKDNVLTDTFTVHKNPKTVNTPTPEFPINQTILLECVELKANNFSATDSNSEHGQSQWQLNTTNDFGVPLYDSWKNYENWYYDINTQSNDDLTDETILGLQPNTTYWWRVRYRDREFNWSDWSTPVSFNTGNSVFGSNLLTNSGAEDGMNGWVVEQGSVESITDGQCGGVSPYEGVRLFAVGGVCNDSPIGRATQMVDVSSYTIQIDTGNYQADFGAFMRDWAGYDIPQIKIYFYDASNSLLGSSNWLSHNTADWTLKEDRINIPIGTRFIKFEMKGVRNNGNDNDSYIDNAFLKIGSVTISCSNLSVTTFEMSKIKVFPNPMKEYGKIQFIDNLFDADDFEIHLTDISGKKYIPKYEVVSDGIIIYKNNLANGFYILSLKQNNLIKNIKLLVE